MSDTRRTLHATIDAQKEKIALYKIRLKDIIKAYKSLTAEKETIEKSLLRLQDNSADPNVKIVQLLESITTLTNEKSKLESSYTEYRKRNKLLLAERDGRINGLVSDVNSLKKQVEGIKESLFAEKKDREEELCNHKTVLKEIQDLLTQERIYKEYLQTEYEKLKTLIGAAPNPTSDKLLLSNELPSIPETDEVKLCQKLLNSNVTADSGVSQFATVNDNCFNQSQRSRIISLENSLQELSESVGNYERLRQTDLRQIETLRLRISQLESKEIVAKTSQAIFVSRGVQCLFNDNDICRLRRDMKLIVTPTQVENSVEIEEKSSYENKNYVVPTSLDLVSEMELLRNANERLRIECAKNKHQIENGFGQKVTLLELELSKQKNRFLQLLDEKQEEIDLLRHNSAHRKVSSSINVDKLQISEGALRSGHVPLSQTAEVDFPDQLLMQEIDTAQNINKKSNRILHHSMQLSFKDKAIDELRVSKRQLENSLRDVQLNSMSKQEILSNRIKELEAKLAAASLRRHIVTTADVSGHHVNAEYMKNVVLKYMLSSDKQSRNRILNAIGILLSFSADEIDTVKAFNSKLT